MDHSPKQNLPFLSKRFKAVAGHVLMIAATLISTRITLSVPRVAGDFKDYPFPLPTFSLLVVRFYPTLLWIACGTILATIYLAWRYRSDSPPTRVTVPLIVCIAAQALLVGGAMLFPVVKFINSYVTH